MPNTFTLPPLPADQPPESYPHTLADQEADQMAEVSAAIGDWERWAQPGFEGNVQDIRRLARVGVVHQEPQTPSPWQGLPPPRPRANRLNEGYYSAEELAQLKVEQARHRVQSVKGLAKVVSQESLGEKQPYYLPKLEYREAHPSPYAPTIGVEIEIYRPTLGLPSVDKIELTEEELSKVDDARQKFYRTADLGVPSGSDGFWEFANAPVNDFRTMTREVQSLVDMGLINKDYQRHPMHLTIGGITSMGIPGRQAFVLARALEASGWSTRSGRLLKPFLTGANAWNHKGVAGVKERGAHELQGKQSTGIEIRTMQFQNLQGFHRLLSGSYYLGAALKAYQEKSYDSPLPAGATMAGREALAAVWGQFSQDIEAIFKQYGLFSPSEPDSWPAPYSEADSTGFWKLAQLMDEAAKDKDSMGGNFVVEIRDALTKARVQAAKLMTPEEPHS